MKFEKELNLWLENAVADSDLINELNSVKNDENEIIERFYRNLEFGTGGLRGIIGAGTNRINIYTVGKAAQGIADFVNSMFQNPSVAIAYDSRIKSDVFAIYAAEVFAANGLKVYMYKELIPTPMLSFAVRKLKCSAGINITASHNPSKYNGLKAYGPDGCQLTLDASEAVLDIIEKIDIFDGVKRSDFHRELNLGNICYIGDDVINAYLDEVEHCAVNPDVIKSSGLKVVYTPLCGAGNKPVRSILRRVGVDNVTVVASQEMPDGNFPTVPYPNPEIRQAFEEAFKTAETVNPDLLLATDPDSDRVGIAVSHNGEYKLLSGNEVGLLLLDYILSQRVKNKTLPESPIVVKTIVTSEMACKIAENYNCELISLLTGFKFIGELIGELEKKGEQSRFVFGYEESYGYLAGSYVRDKDAVVASMLICEMAAYCKLQNKTLVDAMNALYEKYGHYKNDQLSFSYEGVSGMEKMSQIMKSLHDFSDKTLNDKRITEIVDYEKSLKTNLTDGTTSRITLPKSDVIGFKFEDGNSFIVRPSGTEPKIKVYITVVAKTREESEAMCKQLCEEVKAIVL